MNEDTEKALALDVLQSSELNARLLRRLTASPGIIDVQMLRQIPARLMGSLAPLVSLFDELMARYGIDDGSMGTQPLVMEQPWIQNVNSYLTNYNSFSSTTNQFISIPATEQKSRTEIVKMIEERAFTEVEPRLFHPSSSVLPPDPSSSQAETFRVHRRPVRREWESDLTTAPAFEGNPALPLANTSTTEPSAAGSIKGQPATHKNEQPTVIETPDRRVGMAKVIAAVIPAPGDLPLARAQDQRKPGDDASPAQRSPDQANQNQTTGGRFQLVLAKAGGLKQTATPRSSGTEDGHSATEQFTEADKERGRRSENVSREIVAHSSLRSNLESFDLVQSQAALSQIQKRATDLVWRRSADLPTGRDLTSVDSSSRLKAAASSLPQLPRGVQTIKPKSTNRKGEHGTGSRQMTERIVRNISRKLLIERERRGY